MVTSIIKTLGTDAWVFASCGVEAVQDGRIHIEKVNAPFLAGHGSADQFKAGIRHAVERGWIAMHESGT